jgi:hypothetical protein
MSSIAVRNSRGLTILAVVLGVSVLAGACGSDDDDGATTGEVPVVEEDGGLPLADDGEGAPPAAGACLEGEPDCQDTGVSPPAEGLPLPGEADEGADGETSGSSGMVVDGGLSVAEALSGGADGVIAVRGHVFDDGSGPVLCEGLSGSGGESECQGANVALENVDIADAADITISDGVTYSEDEVTLMGVLSDGVLTVDPLVSG